MSEKQHVVVFVRHGESLYNQDNVFTGWSDVGLTEKGREMATFAGKLLKQQNYDFDIAYMSRLRRTVQTFNQLAEEMEIHHIPVVKDFRLNEKHYGALQDLSKKQTIEKYGKEQVYEWRRNYYQPPPKVEPSDPRHPINDSKYKDISPDLLPTGESLNDLTKRVVPCFEEIMNKFVLNDKKVVICAHHNVIRALVKHLDQLDESQVASVEIPLGLPLVYKFDSRGRKLESFYVMEQKQFLHRVDTKRYD